MDPGLPSLDLLLSLVRDERERQLAHFDALDAKAGAALGFAGLLITLAPDVGPVFRTLGVSLAVAAGGHALAAFWPRGLPTVVPSRLRAYLRAEAGFTKLTVHDTLSEFVDEGSSVLESKARRLRRSLVSLAAAAASLAVGMVVDVT